ncbi:hypothetical protein HTV45_15935 [Streptomyces sp. CHD11]|uniref:hypothetical protein n=1 Tax=Streptomyces sp. CHD11 TaxID=2741325 RepID=UPI001BFCAD5F|nr:hypothetical protein [Streptomyces sp. CHD11]MBT3152351.1 hypothetical protein [Streptomyces sp. CHD11]
MIFIIFSGLGGTFRTTRAHIAPRFPRQAPMNAAYHAVIPPSGRNYRTVTGLK